MIPLIIFIFSTLSTISNPPKCFFFLGRPKEMLTRSMIKFPFQSPNFNPLFFHRYDVAIITCTFLFSKNYLSLIPPFPPILPPIYPFFFFLINKKASKWTFREPNWSFPQGFGEIGEKSTLGVNSDFRDQSWPKNYKIKGRK